MKNDKSAALKAAKVSFMHNKFKSTVGNLQIDVSDESYRAIVDGLVKHDGPDIFVVFLRFPREMFFCVSQLIV